MSGPDRRREIQVEKPADGDEQNRGSSAFDDPGRRSASQELGAQKIPHSQVEVRDFRSIELWPDHSVPRGN